METALWSWGLLLLFFENPDTPFKLNVDEELYVTFKILDKTIGRKRNKNKQYWSEDVPADLTWLFTSWFGNFKLINQEYLLEMLF